MFFFRFISKHPKPMDLYIKQLLEKLQKNLTEFYSPSETEKEDVRNLANAKSPEEIQKLIKEILNAWRKRDIIYGVMGSSGSGKSSFINAMRGLKGQDAGAAKVGVCETTTEPTLYKDPRNPNLVYCDLPGVGTPNYPKDDTYLEKIEFEK